MSSFQSGVSGVRRMFVAAGIGLYMTMTHRAGGGKQVQKSYSVTRALALVTPTSTTTEISLKGPEVTPPT